MLRFFVVHPVLRDRRADDALERLGWALEQLGHHVEHGSCSTGAASYDVWIVVPEDYFARGELTEADEPRPTTVGMVLAATGSPRFDVAAHQAMRCDLVLAPTPQAAEELRTRGVDAHFLEAGWCPSAEEDGPIDRKTAVAMLGPLEPAASEVAAELGSRLWDSTVEFRFQPDDTLRSRRVHAVEGQELDALLARTSLLVDVGSGDGHVVDPWLAVRCASLGAVLVTTGGRAVPWLVPGEDYLVVERDHLVDVVPGLLKDTWKLEGVRDHARMTVLAHPFSDPVEMFVELLETRLHPAGRTQDDDVEFEQPESEVVPGGWPTSMDHEVVMGAAMRRVEQELVLVSRRLARMELGLAPGDQPPVRVLTTSAYGSAVPVVSVIVSLHDYAGVVEQALTSVVASAGCDFELLVQDDASSDGSFDVVRGFIEKHDDIPIRLAGMSVNQGPAATRNDLVSCARGQYVFVLDADNGIRPTCIQKLVSALESDSGAAFAYSLIARQMDSKCIGLTSALGWDSDLLRRGNYIDVMSLIRRSVLEDLGGWDSSMVLGWEDFELWARLAESGGRAAFVPEVLSWYRVSLASMSARAEVDRSALWTKVRSSAPRLMS